MPALSNEIVHLNGVDDEAVDKELWGKTIIIAVMIGYPGSKYQIF